MQNQYTIANHTILPLIYRILGPFNHISYLLKEPTTKSLFMFNPLTNIFPSYQHAKYSQQSETKYHSWLIDHITKIESCSQSKLTHIILQQIYQQVAKWKQMQYSYVEGDENVKLLLPNCNNKTQIKPQVIGQISICFIDANGYSKDYNLIGVTHISSTSTKYPILFVNNLLKVCGIDYDEQSINVDDGNYIKSLDKVKYFPNQTYIFPSSIVSQDDLLFAQTIIKMESQMARGVEILNQKIQFYQKNFSNNRDCLIPTTVMEEKLLNPYLSCQKFGTLFGEKGQERAKCFGLLKNLRKQWKKQTGKS